MTPLEAWTAVVSGEDAAVYAYSVAGARVHGGGRNRALTGLDAHRANRSRAAALVVQLGGTPPAAASSYQFPFDVTDANSARRLMAYVDNGLVGTYADAAAASPSGTGDAGADRRWAARTGAECATRAVAWGATPQAFPVAQAT